MRINGAFIDKGPQDWQILQRHGDFASLSISGGWNVPDGFDEAAVQCVMARIVFEETNKPVVNWQKCQTSFAPDHKSGDWRHTFERVPKGGLYRLETKVYCGDMVWGIRGDMVHHLGVGDIYVVIGQSNASGYGRDHVKDAPEIGVHMLRARGRWDLASHPFNDSTDTIYPDNREGSNPGVSPYLHFAKMLKNALNMPIGIIPAAEGGSPIEDWLLQQNGYLYRNMRRYLRDIGNDFCAFLWYQGCTDCRAERFGGTHYLAEFALLVKTLREEYGDKPIYTTQLNKLTTDYSTEGCLYPRRSFGVLRDAQRLAAKQIKDVYVVPSYDLTLSDEIHNSAAANLTIGERLAELALHTYYHLPGYEHCFAPDIERVTKTAPNQTLLRFSHCASIYVLTVPEREMPFICEDDAGEAHPIVIARTDESAITITWNRALADSAKVSLAAEELGAMRVLFDQPSYLPPLAFYRVAVEES